MFFFDLSVVIPNIQIYDFSRVFTNAIRIFSQKKIHVMSDSDDYRQHGIERHADEPTCKS